jgi:hypothetical protein
MSQFSKRANPFRAENGPGDAALGGGTQPASTGGERCLARDCPLPGTVSDSTKGGGPWTCSAHRRAAPEQWPAISERANAEPWLWRALARIAHDGETEDLARKVSEFCVNRGMSDLRYQPEHETVKQWAYRLRANAWGWVETGVCRSTPFGLRERVEHKRPVGMGKLAGLLLKQARERGAIPAEEGEEVAA